MIGIMVDKIVLKRMEGPMDKWADLLTNNKSFYVSPTIVPLFLNFIDRYSRVFVLRGLFGGMEKYIIKCLLDFLCLSLFSFFIIFLAGFFARGWAIFFFLFQPSIIRSFVELRLIRETCAHYGEEEKLFHWKGKLKLYCKGGRLLAYTYIYFVITSSFFISAFTRAYFFFIQSPLFFL